MIKFLFLDIDGVLNSLDFYERRCKDKALIADGYPFNQFDINCVEMLNDVIDKTGAKIVISSSWRFNPDLKSIFKMVGIKHDIFDITPRTSNGNRGTEINLFLQKFNSAEIKYCIVDDDSDMLKEQLPYFVKTSFQTGLTEKTKNEIIEKLK